MFDYGLLWAIVEENLAHFCFVEAMYVLYT